MYDLPQQMQNPCENCEKIDACTHWCADWSEWFGHEWRRVKIRIWVDVVERRKASENQRG